MRGCWKTEKRPAYNSYMYICMHVYVDKMSLIRDSKDKFYLFSQEHGDQVNRPAEGMMSFTVISLFF